MLFRGKRQGLFHQNIPRLSDLTRSPQVFLPSWLNLKNWAEPCVTGKILLLKRSPTRKQTRAHTQSLSCNVDNCAVQMALSLGKTWAWLYLKTFFFRSKSAFLKAEMYYWNHFRATVSPVVFHIPLTYEIAQEFCILVPLVQKQHSDVQGSLPLFSLIPKAGS